tara:strand:- start:723 stop:956 length:234 start_codon:yes stop_codon:yes gene_type:complete
MVLEEEFSIDALETPLTRVVNVPSMVKDVFLPNIDDSKEIWAEPSLSSVLCTGELQPPNPKAATMSKPEVVLLVMIM